MALSPLGHPPPAAVNVQKESVQPDPLPQELARKSQDLAILEANHLVNLSAKNDPLALVFQAAIDAINEELEPSMGANAIERAQQQGIDVSPEATAERIVSLTTAMFGRFQEQRPELSAGGQVDRFIELIGSGIDQGFSEAREILEGLDVLEGTIKADIDRTYDLVQQGLQAFRDSFIGLNEADEATNDRLVP